MTKLIITADIHGSYNTWKKFKEVIKPEDTIAIAGDLFDTVYGRRDNNDFQPEKIKKEFLSLPNPKYFVYGNCDQEWIYPGQKYLLRFNFNGKKFLLRHGHIRNSDISDVDIIIEGHSHIGSIKKVDDKVSVNPGSIAFPKNGVASYAVFEHDEIRLIRITNNHIQNRLKIKNLKPQV